MYDNIIYEVDDPVALITLNRPEVLNAWNDELGAELHDAMMRAGADQAVVGIVVTGAGRGFCAGADMRTLSALSGAGPADTGDVAQHVDAGQGVGGVGEQPEHITDAILGEAASSDATPQHDLDGRVLYPMTIPKPVIAAVNGACAGMAYPFVLSCDLRVVTDNTVFVTAFAQRGLIAEWGLGWLLPRLIGPAAALDLLFSSRRVSGTEAVELGLANYHTTPDDLVPFCRRYVEQLAASVSPTSMAIMKQQVYNDYHRGLAAAERESRRLMVESFGRPDFAEGVRSFLDKRAPEFARLGDR